jgi:cyclopropane fatty-acyl-phospholipid synthase-like methyltransferase
VTTIPSELIAFYENKTQAILRRYGPGPRVHYHTGLVEDRPIGDADAEGLRESLVLSQEKLLEHAAKIWQFETLAGREVLDVGCGLGGAALYLAQEFGARVTAVTIAPSHAELVRQFAAQVGVSDLVIPTIGDALQVQGEHRFDAAVAIDSSSSFARAPWFRRLASVLRPKGRVLIADCFLEDRKYEQPFNSHWCAQIGTLNEYLEAANSAGFREDTIENLSTKAERFWSLSLAHMSAEADTSAPDTISSARMKASRRMHTLVRDGLASGGLRYLLIALS